MVSQLATGWPLIGRLSAQASRLTALINQSLSYLHMALRTLALAWRSCLLVELGRRWPVFRRPACCSCWPELAPRSCSPRPSLAPIGRPTALVHTGSSRNLSWLAGLRRFEVLGPFCAVAGSRCHRLALIGSLRGRIELRGRE